MSKKPITDVKETEEELISKAQSAVSQSNWVVGECADKWTQRYARGRGDGDFAALLGLTADQVFQRRRVWQTFADVYNNYPALKWSHFYAALTWDDAPECLQWADENQSTVSEMKAWRRALRGEDLRTESQGVDEWGTPAAVSYVPDDHVAVRDPSEFLEPDGRNRSGRTSEGESRTPAELVGAVARDSDPGYSPYRSGAGSPAPRESESATVGPRPQASPEQLITRMSTTLERINEALTSEMLKEFKSLPEKKRSRFLKAVSGLSTKTARLL
ncbi:MAG TPA: hypothetical protein VGP63_30685 [Planctomycetaceae bacterium]|jgi:hypothetical protein|nr:hypothetical protein [Planctomycetaceae bacterium]